MPKPSVVKKPDGFYIKVPTGKHPNEYRIENQRYDSRKDAIDALKRRADKRK